MKNTVYVIGLLLVTVLAPASQAATVPPVYEKVGFVVNTDTFSDAFTVPVAGTYQATLTDLEFPAPFSTLLLAVSTTKELQGAATLADPQFTFQAQPGVTYFASVAGIGGGTLNIGLFGAEVALIPIPAAAMLFASALVSLMVVARRKAAQPTPETSPA